MMDNLTFYEDYQLNLRQTAKLLGKSRQNARKMADLLMKKRLCGLTDLFENVTKYEQKHSEKEN
ncbi:hypothetical protein [Qiania dongpingensis]|uniref:Uncharacterized protein n=1 Tax=Qiania dongpingensis TaxID=2763669 RepID=A0A7G9G693_9FIRM|nr:hypothetical protein [Qiania dongpingensis]QNM06325.1 hypothetical protein H9Q78_04080 [Qiania dongpingensis]